MVPQTRENNETDKMEQDYRRQLLRNGVIRNVPEADMADFKGAVKDILEDASVSPKSSVAAVERCKSIYSVHSDSLHSGARIVAATYLADHFAQRPQKIGPRLCHQVELLIRGRHIHPKGLLRSLEECMKPATPAQVSEEQEITNSNHIAGERSSKGKPCVPYLESYLLLLQSILRVCPRATISSQTKRIVIEHRDLFPEMARKVLLAAGKASDQRGRGRALDGDPTSSIYGCLLEAQEVMDMRGIAQEIQGGDADSCVGFSLAPDDGRTSILMGCRNRILQIDFRNKVCVDQIDICGKDSDVDVAVVSMTVNRTGDKMCAGMLQAGGPGCQRAQLAHLWKDTDGVWQVDRGWQSDQTCFLHVSRLCFLGDLVCAGVVEHDSASLSVFDGVSTLLRRFPTFSPVSDVTVLDHYCVGCTTRAPMASVSIFDLRCSSDTRSQAAFCMPETDLTAILGGVHGGPALFGNVAQPNHLLAAGEAMFLFDRRALSRGPIAGGMLSPSSSQATKEASQAGSSQRVGNVAVRLGYLRVPGFAVVADTQGLSTVRYDDAILDANSVVIPDPVVAYNGSFDRNPFYDVLVIEDAVFGCNADGLSSYRATWNGRPVC